MKNNTIKTAGTFVLGAGLAFIVEQNLNAQINYPEQNKQKVIAAYFNATEAAVKKITIPANVISTLENFLGSGDGLYSGTSSGLQTFPANGAGSINLLNGQYLVRTVQVGSGQGKFMAENNRDMSFTWAIYANRAGYDGHDSIRTDDRLKQIVSMNSTSGISPFEIKIIRESNGTIKDILYTGTATNKPDVHDHGLMAEGKNTGTLPGHILMVPGKYNAKTKTWAVEDYFIPLDDALKLAGIELVVQAPPELPPAKPADKPCPEPVADSIEHKMAAIGITGTNGRAVPGLFVAYQISPRLDLEVGYAFLKINGDEGLYDLFTQEVKEHPLSNNTNNPIRLTGYSELTEQGQSVKKLHMINSSLIYYGKKGIFGVGLGLNGDIANETIDGKEDRVTYFKNEAGDVLEFDELVTRATKNINHYSLMPSAGVRLNLGWLKLGMDYVLPVNMLEGINDKELNTSKGHYDSKYIGNDSPGSLRFTAAFNIDISKNLNKTKKQKSTNGYYNRGSR